MTTKAIKLSTGRLCFINTCETCQRPAYIGYNSNTRKAKEAFDRGESEWYRHMGHWFCAKHDRGGR